MHAHIYSVGTFDQKTITVMQCFSQVILIASPLSAAFQWAGSAAIV